MRSTKYLGALAATACLCLAALPAAHADTDDNPADPPAASAVAAAAVTPIGVNNPDFFSPQAPPDGWLTRTEVPGWTVTKGDVDIIGVNLAATPLNSQSVTVNGGIQGGISQNLRTTPGAKTSIGWWQAADPACGAKRQQYTSAVLRPSGDSLTAKTRLLQAPAHYPPVWTEERLDFTAQDRITTLTFDSNTSGVCGVEITGVWAEQSTGGNGE